MRYGVLGPVEAVVDDGVVAVGGPQQRRLLALMLSRPGQSVSSERVVDCLWPDGLAPDGAARSVTTYVSRLRAALGDSSISTVPEGYRLELNGSVLDSQQFEKLLSEAGTADPGRAVEIYDRALDLWRGDAYGDFGGEWWLLSEANRLNELRVVAMEERAEAILAVGHHHRVVPELERLVGDHPLRERPVSLLMRALFATGRHADALRVFHLFRTQLGEETGLDPSDELVALERSLASGRPADANERARLLRGYTIHEVLGEGAFGRVYSATQPGTNREVAIKAIRPELSNSAEFIQRFEAEAQLVARLEHPHIVPLYDYWREPSGAYLVFRLLLGGTALGALVSTGPFSVARVSRLVEEVGSALLAAHTASVVHCDIKPSNVLFDESGNGYLSDFGIAVTSISYDQAGDRTRVYAAPELIDRTGDTVQSDIFSFGCTLWELLVGVSPLATMHPSDRPRLPSLAGLMAESSETLDAVLARATAADTGSRFESMAEFIVAWRDAVGRPEGVLSPIDGRRIIEPDSSRRRAVRALSVAVSSAVNPYKGLRAFGEADAANFFGRNDVSSALREMLIVKSFVAVVGPSGSGKSSLVHAGLIPLLRNDGVRVATMVPGDRPASALREALSQVAATDDTTNDPSEMVQKAVADGTGQIVLIIDQFEECWTLAESSERERFLSAVMVAGQFGVRCVTTVRADLYDRPLQHPLIGQMVADGTFALPPLSPRALEEAVARPAEQNGVEFDDGVVSAIVAEANAQPAGLPLLQFAMAELYEHRVDNRVTATTLQHLGGLGGSIGRRAEEIYTSLDEDMQANTRQLFARLIAPGHGSPDTRRRARIGELSEPDRIVADQFVHARLLVADRDHVTREPVIEVAHEALLVNWARLREWLEADRRWLAQLQHLAAATRAWDEGGRADGELYRGSRLEAVVEVLPEREQQLSAEENAFVDASRAARDAGLERERRNARRVRRFLVTTACLLVLALAAGTIAFGQREQARTAATKAKVAALVGRSLLLRGSQRDTAALLAIEAFRQADTPRTRSALLSTFTTDVGYLGSDRLPESLVGRQVAGDVVAARGIVLPNGAGSLVMGPDQRFRSYNLDSGAVGEPWPALTDFPPGDSRFTSSTNGRFVAQMFWPSATVDSTILGVFDITTHEPVVGPINIPFRTDNAVVSPDGTRVYVSGGYDGTVVEYSLADGSELGRLVGLQPPGDSFLLWATAGMAFVTGGLLAVGSVGGTVRLVDPNTLAVESEIDSPRGTTERLVAIDSGTALIGAGLFGRVRLDVVGRSATPVWQVDTSDLNKTLPGFAPPEPQFDDCSALVVAERLGRYYCGDRNSHLEERDLATGGLIRQLDAQNWNAGSMWLATDETELVSFSGNDSLVARWRVDGSGPITRRVGDGYSPISYSPDGKLLLADSGRTSVGESSGWVLVDPHSGFEVVVPGDAVKFPEWRADGAIKGFVDSNAASRLATIDPKTSKLATTSLTLTAKPTDVFSSQHRTWLYYPTGGDPNGPGEIWTVDTDTDTRINPTLHVDTFVTGSGTDNGDRVAVTTKSGIVLFDGRTGKSLHVFSDTNSRGADIVAGKLFVAVGAGGTVSVYDLNTFTLLSTLGGVPGLGRVQGSDDGSLAFAAGTNRSGILYDPTIGEQIGDPIVIPDNEVIAFAVRPDGKELAVGGGAEQQFTVWDLDPQHWISAACKIAARNLTPQEWTTNIGDLAPYHRTCPDYG